MIKVDEYDSFDNLTHTYEYNPVDGKIDEVEYAYNDLHLCVRQTAKSDNKTVYSKAFDYNGGLIVSSILYDNSLLYSMKETVDYDENKLPISCKDKNNVVTTYSHSADCDISVLVGDTGSPSTEYRNIYYKNSDFVKEISSGSYKNNYTYFSDGSIHKTCFAYKTSLDCSEVIFVYNEFGDVSAVKIGEVSLVTYVYEHKHMLKQTYADGVEKSFTYDEKDRITSITDGRFTVSITYSDDNKDKAVITHENGIVYSGEVVNKNGITSRYTVGVTNKNKILRIDKLATDSIGVTNTVEYYIGSETSPFDKVVTVKDRNGKLNRYNADVGNLSNSYSYDDFFCLKTKNIYTDKTKVFEFKYDYERNGNHTTEKVSTEWFYAKNSLKGIYSYEYYVNGNLKNVTSVNSVCAEYFYDEYSRLIEERNYSLGKAYKMIYDAGGNILKKETYAINNGVMSASAEKIDLYDYVTVDLSSGHNSAWKDQLRRYNGQTIKYNAGGNPTEYLGKTMQWHGNRLISCNDVVMDYDYNGLRIKKGDKYYLWNGDRLIYEFWTENGSDKFIYYLYDESGVRGIDYNGEIYYFRKNILGDVLELYDINGVLQCKYVYDAWGNHKIYNVNGEEVSESSSHIGNINPIRYRGYYYDREFSLYYLQARYYDSVLGRFISPDGVEYFDSASVIGYNLYAYCNDNPIMYFDPDGNSVLALLAILAVTTVAGGVLGGILSAKKDLKGWNFAKNVILGASIGLAVGGLFIMGALLCQEQCMGRAQHC